MKGATQREVKRVEEVQGLQRPSEHLLWFTQQGRSPDVQATARRIQGAPINLPSKHVSSGRAKAARADWHASVHLTTGRDRAATPTSSPSPRPWNPAKPHRYVRTSNLMHRRLQYPLTGGCLSLIRRLRSRRAASLSISNVGRSPSAIEEPAEIPKALRSCKVAPQAAEPAILVKVNLWANPQPRRHTAKALPLLTDAARC